MSSYAESVLADGEKIVYQSYISHWYFLGRYVVGGFFLMMGLAMVFVSLSSLSSSRSFGPVIGLLFIMMGILLILYSLIKRFTTELALTNRRLIVKRGLISRETTEMNLNKVESIDVNQGPLGRLLNYGDVTVVGTGASHEPLRGISKPLDMRKQLGALLQK